MLVSVVHRVAILNTVLSVVCLGLCLMLVLTMVDTYSSMGLVMGLYVASFISFCSLFHVDVSALSICIVLRFLFIVVYVSLEARVSPSILGLVFMGSVLLLICSANCVMFFAGFVVKGVHGVLPGLRMRC